MPVPPPPAKPLPLAAQVDVAAPSGDPEWSFQTELLWGELDSLASRMDSGSRLGAMNLAVATSVAASVGYVIWTMRGSYLLSGVLTATPLWRQFDPLAILNFWEKTSRGRTRQRPARPDEDDDETLQSLLGRTPDRLGAPADSDEG